MKNIHIIHCVEYNNRNNPIVICVWSEVFHTKQEALDREAELKKFEYITDVDKSCHVWVTFKHQEFGV